MNHHHAPIFLITQLNALVDTGQFDNISLSDVHPHANARDTLEWLKSLAGQNLIHRSTGTPALGRGSSRTSMTSLRARRAAWMTHAIGLRNRGLCLLIAWTNGLLQQGTGWKPKDDIPRSFRNA
jgi:hypothetical protein